MMTMTHPAGVVPILAAQGIPVSGYPGVHLVSAEHVAHVSTAAAVAQAQGEAAAHSVAQFTGPTISSVQLQEAELVLENDKKAIYKHPLFPLLALLFEKCEKATQTPECPTADGFNVDIQAFVQQQERENKPFFSEDSELDNLMVKSIQVLRIHLLELEKVNELCKDFCNRYIACLKGKLQSENILRTENSSGDSFDDSFDSPHQGLSQGGSPGVSSGVSSVGGNTVVLQSAGGVQQAAVALNPGQIVSGGTVYQMVQTPQGIVAQPIQIQTAVQPQVASVIHGSTPLSQIGVPAASTPVSHTQTVTSPHSSTPAMPLSPSEDDDSARKKAKRGVLPKQATQVMKSWLFQHIVHPYPTEDEKRQIAGQTNLTLLQVNNWFINARRRILQPMLDASNPEGSKAKKNKPQNNRPVQRFWPDSIANLQPQPQQVSSIQQQQQQQTGTGSTAGPTTGTQTITVSGGQSLIIPTGTYFTQDGQLISTQAVSLEALHTSALTTSHVNPMLSEAQPNRGNSPALMMQNGDQDGKDVEVEGDGTLQSSDLGMDNSDSESDLVGED